MRKVLLNSEDEYFKYCTEHNVGRIMDGNDGSPFTDAVVAFGDTCCYVVERKDAPNLCVGVKPKSYPCIMVWEWIVDVNRGLDCKRAFIYEDDFGI
jgi:hypothetical protein